ncbi:MAG TPA: hypothetical protein DCF49_05145 [Lachnospiraceae bacterium]|nr:hypothetical protein [Lachnospiraceae bacterium]
MGDEGGAAARTAHKQAEQDKNQEHLRFHFRSYIFLVLFELLILYYAQLTPEVKFAWYNRREA